MENIPVFAAIKTAESTASFCGKTKGKYSNEFWTTPSVNSGQT